MRALTITATVIVLLLCPSAFLCSAQQGKKLRSDLERELPAIEAAYREAPGDAANRRAYASRLFMLGNIWEANDVVSPLATASSSNVADLELGAKVALMTCDYERAEILCKRLKDVAEEGSDSYGQAIKGLVMTYYQTDQYAKVKDLKLSDQTTRGLSTLLTFMQMFEGEPYQVEWANKDKVAHTPIVNDFTLPGTLPLVKLQINGHDVEFILDTGGDRLYIDEAVAKKVGIRNIITRKARYAYTKGKTVEEFLGAAKSVKMGEVTMKNVPVIVAKWKALGISSDGVVTTQMLKQFLSTVNYEKKEITFRERSEAGRRQLLDLFGDRKPHRMPFFMSGTHLMFAKGSLNGRSGLNLFVDSGLASSMELVILDETVEDLGLNKSPVRGTKYYFTTLASHGLGDLIRGRAQALGNVLVEENSYRRYGFLFDALISHQYLRHLGSWTIDFDTMTYYFSSSSEKKGEGKPAVAKKETKDERVVAETAEALKKYVGKYKSELIKSEITVTDSDGKLVVNATGNLRGKFTLKRTRENGYAAVGTPQPVTFDFQVADGKTAKVLVSVSGQGPFPFDRE